MGSRIASRFVLAGIALAISVPATAFAEDAACYDWAVVGDLNKQTCLGPPQVEPGEISLDCVFEWQVTVRRTIVGQQVPNTLTVRTIAHTYLIPRAARQVVLFLKRADQGGPLVVRWDVIPRDSEPAEWTRDVTAKSHELDLARCP
jgi:hypothetical protein